MATIAPEPVVEVGDGLSARWNRHVSNVPSHLSITNEDGRLVGRVFADSQSEAWNQLPEVVSKITSERAQARFAHAHAIEEDSASVSKAKDEAIKRILSRRIPQSGSQTIATTAGDTSTSTESGGNA